MRLVVAHVGPTALARLGSPAGRIVGILGPPLANDRRAPGHVAFRYRAHAQAHATRGCLVFERDKTRVEVPVDVTAGPGHQSARTVHVPVPKPLEAGRYRVFLRLYLDDIPVSDSYGLTVDLP